MKERDLYGYNEFFQGDLESGAALVSPAGWSRRSWVMHGVTLDDRWLPDLDPAAEAIA
jgi:hypothetical protein